MSDFVIRTRNLTKYFGAKCVVRDLNLNVPRGSIYGFLGRNGSGKTTSLRMILGLLAPNWGTSTILGHDSQQLPPETRARIGYLAEGHPVCGWMRVKDAEAYQSRFYAQWNHELFSSVLDFFRVDPRNQARSLSRGERAGLCLAMVLAPEPDVLVLDDPAIGLDPVARRSLLQSMVYATRKADRTIIFSSHLLADIERMADHIAVLDYSVLRGMLARHVSQLRSAIRTDISRQAAGSVCHSRPHSFHGARQPASTHRGERNARNPQRARATRRDSYQRSSDQPGRLARELSGRQDAKRQASRIVRSRDNGRRCVMKAVFLKELREGAKWALAIFGVLGMLVLFEIRKANPFILYQFAQEKLVFFAPLAGLLMGIAQSFFETRPDNWAFVVHRPLSRRALFAAKCCAGLLLLYVSLALPCLLIAAWAARPGNVATPFHWSALLPMLADILNAGSFYFAGIVVTLHKARWFGSRLLPLGLGVGTSLGVVVMPDFWQAAAIALVGLTIGGLAAWNVFASGGTADRGGAPETGTGGDDLRGGSRHWLLIYRSCRCAWLVRYMARSSPRSGRHCLARHLEIGGQRAHLHYRRRGGQAVREI